MEKPIVKARENVPTVQDDLEQSTPATSAGTSEETTYAIENNIVTFPINNTEQAVDDFIQQSICNIRETAFPSHQFEEKNEPSLISVCDALRIHYEISGSVFELVFRRIDGSMSFVLSEIERSPYDYCEETEKVISDVLLCVGLLNTEARNKIKLFVCRNTSEVLFYKTHFEINHDGSITFDLSNVKQGLENFAASLLPYINALSPGWYLVQNSYSTGLCSSEYDDELVKLSITYHNLIEGKYGEVFFANPLGDFRHPKFVIYGCAGDLLEILEAVLDKIGMKVVDIH